ncbi:MAG: hypothetical protein Q4A19_08960 [Johnsonella sp.]|nr:hypothetical protein [Johnsonella sp.]
MFLLGIGAIIAAAVSVAKTIGITVIGLESLKTVGQCITRVAKELGLINEKNDVEELGDMALQAEGAGIFPEKFDSYQAYIRAVENEEGYRYAPEKTEDIKNEEKIRKGIELSTAVTMEKFPNMPIGSFFEFMGRMEVKQSGFFTEAKLRELGRIMEENVGCIADVLHYMDGTQKDDIAIERGIDILKRMEKAENPSISDKEAFKKALSVRN